LLPKYIVLVEKRKDKQAIGSINEIVRANPQYYTNYAVRARVFNQMDENELALADANKALCLNPNQFMALTTKAVMHLNRSNEAIKCSDKAFA
jgi:Tfp pilus assembly protein PilF